MTNEKDTTIEEKELKAYEIGFLLSPVVAEEVLNDTINEELVSLIEEHGGKVQSRTAPEMKTLAYTVTHSVGNERSKYKNAYFGALVFEMSPDQVASLSEALKTSEKVIRTLITIFEKEDKPAPRSESASKKVEEKTAKEDEKATEPVSEEEIDKKIDDLLESETA